MSTHKPAHISKNELANPIKNVRQRMAHAASKLAGLGAAFFLYGAATAATFDSPAHKAFQARMAELSKADGTKTGSFTVDFKRGYRTVLATKPSNTLG